MGRCTRRKTRRAGSWWPSRRRGWRWTRRAFLPPPSVRFPSSRCCPSASMSSASSALSTSTRTASPSSTSSSSTSTPISRSSSIPIARAPTPGPSPPPSSRASCISCAKASPIATATASSTAISSLRIFSSTTTGASSRLPISVLVALLPFLSRATPTRSLRSGTGLPRFCWDQPTTLPVSICGLWDVFLPKWLGGKLCFLETLSFNNYFIYSGCWELQLRSSGLVLVLCGIGMYIHSGNPKTWHELFHHWDLMVLIFYRRCLNMIQLKESLPKQHWITPILIALTSLNSEVVLPRQKKISEGVISDIM